MMMAAPAAAPTTSMPMMARVDRLDLLLAYLEEMHHHHMRRQHRRSTATTASSSSSSPSTPAYAFAAGEDLDSSAGSTPRSWRRRSSCRPAKEVLEEAQAKGTLVDRIAFLEDRVLKMEEDMVVEIAPPDKQQQTTPLEMATSKDNNTDRVRRKKKKGLKSLVKSCVRGNLKTKD